MSLAILTLLFIPGAVLCDSLLGDPSNRFHPVCFIGRLARWAEPFWRQILPNKAFFAGTLAGMTCCLVMISSLLLVWFSICWFFDSVWLQACLALSVLYIFIAPSGLSIHAKRVIKALETDTIEKARYEVSMIVGRNTNQLDQYGVARATIESVSENLTDGVISSLFWAFIGFLIGGFLGSALGVTIHRTFNILDALWGKKNEQYIRFGTFAARTDDLLNFLPARLSLLMIAFSSLWISKSSCLNALKIGWKYRYAHASPNSAWSEAAFAGALNLKLGGPVKYKDLEAPYPWIGEGNMDATTQDINKSLRLMWTTTWSTSLLLSSILIIITIL